MTVGEILEWFVLFLCIGWLGHDGSIESDWMRYAAPAVARADSIQLPAVSAGSQVEISGTAAIRISTSMTMTRNGAVARNNGPMRMSA